jgi:hypothetical protein
MMAGAAALVLILMTFAVVCAETMPLPFTRELALTSPLMTGNDVIIFQNLIIRDASVSAAGAGTAVGTYDAAAEHATVLFQEANGMKGTGVFDAITAQLLLAQHSADGE